MHEVIDDFVDGVRARGSGHGREIDRRRMPGNGLRPLEGDQVAFVPAIPCVVVLVAVDHHVRFRHHVGRGVAFLRRLRDVHASREALADALVRSRHGSIGRAEALDVREEHLAKHVAALKKRGRRDPGSSAGPAGDVRRIEERLAQPAGRAAEIRNRRHLAQSELLVRRDHQLDGALDLRRVRGWAVEIPGEKDLLQERLDLIAALPERAAEARPD